MPCRVQRAGLMNRAFNKTGMVRKPHRTCSHHFFALVTVVSEVVEAFVDEEDAEGEVAIEDEVDVAEEEFEDEFVEEVGCDCELWALAEGRFGSS